MDAATAQARAVTAAKPARLSFIDNIKILLTILVVMHHAGQPYGPTGGRWPLTHAEHERMLGPFFHVNASYFMALFFLISAYFLPRAYERKGAVKFLKDRLLRFGVPVLFFGLIVFPVLFWLFDPKAANFPAFWFQSVIVEHKFEFGHLWFLSHLLVYAVIYVILGRLGWLGKQGVTPRRFPSNLTIAAYVTGLAMVSIVVRHWFPIDRWVFIGVPTELAHLPQYFSFFVIGILAYRFGWLQDIPRRTGQLWLAIGIATVAFRYTYTAARWRFLRGPGTALDFIWNLWEALLCVGMCLGLIYLFRACCNWQGTFHRFLSVNAYGVYLFHLPILIAIQVALEQTAYGPVTLTLISGVATLAACYLLTAMLRWIPGVKRVL